MDENEYQTYANRVNPELPQKQLLEWICVYTNLDVTISNPIPHKLMLKLQTNKIVIGIKREHFRFILCIPNYLMHNT